MRFPQGWELVVLLLVILVLFGSRRLPDAARGLGRSLRIFKSEVSELRDDDKPEPKAEQEAQRQADPPADAPRTDAPRTDG